MPNWESTPLSSVIAKTPPIVPSSKNIQRTIFMCLAQATSQLSCASYLSNYLPSRLLLLSGEIRITLGPSPRSFFDI